jgi:4-phosphopantoate--beta-alanine ligase
MGDVPKSHPRYGSLMARKRLTEAAGKGLLADSALIAHGRGEAFDYLLGEATCPTSRAAIRETATRLKAADRAVISLNGNAVALAGASLLACAGVLGCAVEINIYYRTPERMRGLLAELESHRDAARLLLPSHASEIDLVPILGASPDGRIPGLEGPRADCHAEGILTADVILVPLEDGDRCEALIALGKTVCVIDLNPLSRTARTATVTIVDELTRCMPLLLADLLDPSDSSAGDWHNDLNLEKVLTHMLTSLQPDSTE